MLTPQTTPAAHEQACPDPKTSVSSMIGQPPKAADSVRRPSQQELDQALLLVAKMAIGFISALTLAQAVRHATAAELVSRGLVSIELVPLNGANYAILVTRLPLILPVGVRRIERLLGTRFIWAALASRCLLNQL